jgi:hypothetical protein
MATKKSKETAKKISQENYQQRSGQGVQNGKRQNLGGDLPEQMPPKPSKMDGVIHVPLLPH